MPVRLRLHSARGVAAASKTDVPTLESARLLERLRESDVAALDEVLELMWAPLVIYLTGLMQSRAVAEDVAQETFFRLWERRTTLRADGSLRGFVYRVARNLAMTERRRERVQERAELGRLDEQDADEQDAVGFVEIHDRSLHRQLLRAVNELPERRREVLLLHAVQGLSYKEIGRLLGIAPQTVANQFSAALATLRRTVPLESMV